MNTFDAGSYVMNNQTGKSYMITTETVQTRGRRQVIGTGIRQPEITRFSESHLTPLTLVGAMICHEAEKIIRAKQKLTESDQQILAMHKALVKEIVK